MLIQAACRTTREVVHVSWILGRCQYIAALSHPLTTFAWVRVEIVHFVASNLYWFAVPIVITCILSFVIVPIVVICVWPAIDLLTTASAR